MPGGRAPASPVSLLLLFGLVVALLSTGCKLTIEEQDSEPSIPREVVAGSSSGMPEYEVAISAIDFDPPLQRAMLITTQKMKLLAAVENRGTKRLSQLLVEARVSSRGGEYSAQDRTQLWSLAPGETRIAEFVGVAPGTVMTGSRSYQITVTVESQEPGVKASRELLVRVAEQ